MSQESAWRQLCFRINQLVPQGESDYISEDKFNAINDLADQREAQGVWKHGIQKDNGLEDMFAEPKPVVKLRLWRF